MWVAGGEGHGQGAGGEVLAYFVARMRPLATCSTTLAREISAHMNMLRELLIFTSCFAGSCGNVRG